MERLTGVNAYHGSDTGAWDREARRALLLAAELGVGLDAESLLLCDVRDLQSLQQHLRLALAVAARQPWSAPAIATIAGGRLTLRRDAHDASGSASALIGLASRLSALRQRWMGR